MEADSRDFAAIDAWLQPWQLRRLSIQNRLKGLQSAPPPAKFAAPPAMSAPVLRRSEHVAQLAEPPPAASAAPAFEGVGERVVTTRNGFLTSCTSHQDQSRHVTEAAGAAAAAVMRAATVASSAAATEDAVAAGDDAASAVEAAAVDAAVMEVAAALDAAGYWPEIGTVGARGLAPTFHPHRGEEPAPVPAAARYYTAGAALARSGSSRGPSYAVRHLPPQRDPASATSRQHDYEWPEFNGITLDNWEERSRNVGWLAAQNEAAEIAAKQRLGLLPSAQQPPLQPQPALPSRLLHPEGRARVGGRSSPSAPAAARS